MPKTSIIVRDHYEFCHRYADAPQEVLFLRNLHRHIFNYEVELEVFHDDRELEFIMVKNRLREFIDEVDWPNTASCEQMATDIGKYLRDMYGFDRALSVSVFEDNENGAKVVF